MILNEDTQLIRGVPRSLSTVFCVLYLKGLLTLLCPVVAICGNVWVHGVQFFFNRKYWSIRNKQDNKWSERAGDQQHQNKAATRKEKSRGRAPNRALPWGTDVGSILPLSCTEEKKSWELEGMTFHVVSDSFEGSKFSWSLLLKLEVWNPRAGGIYKDCWLPFLRTFGKIGYF